MVQIALIGISAGAASALLFASVASGSLMAIVLFYLAPLPIVIAAVGWSHMAGLIGAVVAAACLGVVFDGFFFLAFLVGVGLPAWWLGYLALLARPVPQAGEDALEWFPAGHLVAWAALLGALVVVAAVPNFGFDAASFEGGLKRAFERVLRLQTGTPAGEPLKVPGINDPNRLIDFLVAAIPPTAAVLTTLTSVVNLWLAGRIVQVSGRLKRPWPDVPALTFPSYLPAALAAAVAGSFLPGLVGILAGVLAAALLMAYALMGLAVVHSLTRGVGARPFMLGSLYAIVGMFGWPILILAVLGLADTILDIRGRAARRRGPPTATT